MKTPITKLCIIAVFLCFMCGSAFASVPFIDDDFSTNTGYWTYKSAAYRNAASQYVILTPPYAWTWGQTWLVDNVFEPFHASFRYRAGGGSGADGLVFMFYKKSDYAPSYPDYGGSLGFSAAPHASRTPVPGYGIEFDNYYNGGGYNDPSGRHVALIKDQPGNHLASKDDNRTEDNQWHDVEVIVRESSVEVYVDGGLEIAWSGAIDRTYGGMGFSAATGSLSNWHIIDDFSLEPLVIEVAIDIKPGGDPNCINNNGKGAIPVAVFGSEEFDVYSIDPATLDLEGMPVKSTGKNGRLLVHYEDVNMDGYMDLVVQFQDIEGALAADSTEATLNGALYNGTPIVGSDSVCMVP